MLEEIQNIYVKLYSDTPLSFDPGVCKNFLESLNIPKFSDENNSQLDQPLTKSEVYGTVLSMNLNNSPGFDGLPIEFYIVF